MVLTELELIKSLLGVTKSPKEDIRGKITCALRSSHCFGWTLGNSFGLTPYFTVHHLSHPHTDLVSLLKLSDKRKYSDFGSTHPSTVTKNCYCPIRLVAK